MYLHMHIHMYTHTHSHTEQFLSLFNRKTESHTWKLISCFLLLPLLTCLWVHLNCSEGPQYLTIRERSTRQKKKYQRWTKPMDKQLDLIDIYRVFHPTKTECTFFSAALETFSKIDHILANKACLCKWKRIKIITCIFQVIGQWN